jgi:hypothetical protein
MKEVFVEKAFRDDSLDVIEKANVIINEYQAQGFTLTLRQLYYQFVARDFIANKMNEYKRLGSIINDGRLAGLIDWAAMEDRVRNLDSLPTWPDPHDFLGQAPDWYREDLWKRQPVNVEVWIEKDALAGVIEPVCHRWRLPSLACRGYVSQSELYSAGKRFFRDACDNHRRTLVLHLGDHDPSGIDMTRDNLERLRMFSDTDLGSTVDVKRIALNFDQIEQYDPPPNPAKETDSRAEGYIREYGESSWELDALDPAVIDGLIEAEIQAVLDKRRWKKALKIEEENRERIRDAARWLQDNSE